MKYFKGFASEVAIKPLESLVKKDLEKILNKVEDELFNNINSTSEKYNDLQQSNFKLGKLNNFASLDLLNLFFPSFYKNSLIAYKMGLEDQRQEFLYKKKLDLNNDMRNAIKGDCINFINQMSKTYETLIERQLMASLRNKDNFQTFVVKLKDYGDFKKSLEGSSYAGQKTEKFPETPSKTTFIAEVGAFLHKQFTNAKVFLMKEVGGVSYGIYHTQEDEKVSTICRDWNNVRLPIDKLSSIIPQHANCRCWWESG